MRVLMILLLTMTGMPALAQDAEMGEALFLARCAACHGETAMGDGPMAPLLTVQVPALTGLAAANGGLFPRAAVVRRVDGTAPLTAHGGPMPVYGKMLGGGSAVIDGPDGTVIETSGEVLAIALYLESLQAE